MVRRGGNLSEKLVKKKMKIGLDVGSTTLKCVVYSEEGEPVFQEYERHYSQIAEKASGMLSRIQEKFPELKKASLCVSGSAGMGLAEDLDIPFVQEVYATRTATRKYLPQADVVIELGGEDAKILFLTGSMEVRMNGSCAGGTGAFIDQMATLLSITPTELNEIAGESERTYSIASRCGVFAKSDIQALLNQGAQKNDIAASILVAVVNQTIAGLAQGREITGNVVYLGGPLTFFSRLREAFDRILGVKGICPENSLYYVAAGAALSEAGEEFDLEEITDKIKHYSSSHHYQASSALFQSQAEYEEFVERHQRDKVDTGAPLLADKKAYVGIDAGSTTVKAVAVNEDGDIIFSHYLPNSGNPVPLVREFLLELYRKFPDIQICSAASTGYGEEIIKNAFGLDMGVVETIAHFTAARKFEPEVDFIIDIGGQDIKCFQIKNGTIDNIFLNEACSSGCGSFLQTFAGALGYQMADFAKLGLFADSPVDLGSRCTVFMNSSVKQAQKDGASVEDISAGLSISVVRNAIYKVIRAANADDLGQHIVVQGGTFLNDAVLRSFEREIGREVTRPTISGIMGAYGAALAAKEAGLERSALLSPEALATFTHEAKPATCKLCTNHCSLTINRFDGGRKFISGNRCSRPLGQEKVEIPDLMKFKYEYLRTLQGKGTGDGSRGRIGLPFGLNMYENLPFWYTLFTELNFEVVLSPESTRSLYIKGQQTIPSDTVCYPAKLLHGHVMALLEEGVDTIFYPCMSYNFDEHLSDNHYNCPVVAYYPDLLGVNIPALGQVNYLHPNLGLHRPKDFEKKGAQFLQEAFGIPKREAVKAIRKAYEAYDAFRDLVRRKGAEYIDWARANGHRILVVAGRPYHMDPEINHGINDLITGFGFVLVTEDAVFQHMDKQPRHVLNQWTYHARMYNAARYVCTQPDMAFLQLVSFGCGVDAITTDELRSILEEGGDLYTQIKIDDISNLGAVRIRIRSLMAALDARDAQAQKGGQ